MFQNLLNGYKDPFFRVYFYLKFFRFKNVYNKMDNISRQRNRPV